MARRVLLLVAVVALACVAGAEKGDAVFYADPTAEGSCDLNIRLAWSADTGSAAYAAPLLTDLHSDGHKEIVLPTFTHYVEALDGATGNDVHGWPFAHPKLRSQASPKLFDLEHDGTPEIMVTTYDAEFLFFRENGTAIEGYTIKMPRATIKKRWTDFAKAHLKDLDEKDKHRYDEIIATRHKISMRGNANPTDAPPKAHEEKKLGKDASHAEHGSRAEVGVPEAQHAKKDAAGGDKPATGVKPTAPAQEPKAPSPPTPAPTGRKLQQLEDVNPHAAGSKGDAADGGDADAPVSSADQSAPGADDDAAVDDYVSDMDHAEADEHDDDERANYAYDDDYYYGDDDFGHAAPSSPSHVKKLDSAEGRLSAEAKASLDLIFHPELFEAAHAEIQEGDPIFRPRNEQLPLADERSEKVHVDAHILATPTITDLDYDGAWDIVVPVTYFFDAEHYANPENIGALPPDVDTDNYVYSVLATIDARSGRVKWTRELDLTTKKAAFPAYATGSATVINLDDDGMLDIIVGTSSGHLYAFDANGNNKRGFPVQVGPILGQPLAEDVNGDGKLDICVTDAKGMISCFDRNGVLIWDRTVNSPLADGLVAGDVNGDGVLDVVGCTTDGNIWALDGRLGSSLNGFPVRVGSPSRPAGIVGTALLVNLNNTEPPFAADSDIGKHIVVTAMDGAMYIVSGTSACMERHDIGHHSYTPVLTDDVLGNGHMDLVVTTLTGQVFVFESDAPFTPLQAWPSQVIGMNGLTAREGHLGVKISPESRTPHHVRGASFTFMFEIVDERPSRRNGAAPTAYFVAVHVGHQLLLFTRLYLEPGKHTVHVPVPYERKYATVYVSMRLPNGLHFEDSVPIAFNMHFMDGIKYLVLVPFVAVMSVLFFVHRRHEVEDQPSIFDDEEMYMRAQLARRRRVRRPGLG